MLERELVRESVRGAGEDRRVAARVQRRAAAQQPGLSDAGRVCARNERGKGLWKRRCVEKYRTLSHSAWKSRKRRGIPTFPQPRRRRFNYRRAGERSRCRIMTCAESGGRSPSRRRHTQGDTEGECFVFTG